MHSCTLTGHTETEEVLVHNLLKIWIYIDFFFFSSKYQILELEIDTDITKINIPIYCCIDFLLSTSLIRWVLILLITCLRMVVKKKPIYFPRAKFVLSHALLNLTNSPETKEEQPHQEPLRSRTTEKKLATFFFFF